MIGPRYNGLREDAKTSNTKTLVLKYYTAVSLLTIKPWHYDAESIWSAVSNVIHNLQITKIIAKSLRAVLFLSIKPRNYDTESIWSVVFNAIHNLQKTKIIAKSLRAVLFLSNKTW